MMGGDINVTAGADNMVVQELMTPRKVINSMTPDQQDLLRQVRDILPVPSTDLEITCRELVYSLRDSFLGYKDVINGLDDTDFFEAPASTQFHGNFKCGLVLHSLKVLRRTLILAPSMLPDNYTGFNLCTFGIAAFLHDLCKVDMYELDMRNVKNKHTGKWESQPYYKVRDDYVVRGHGIESVMRLRERGVNLPLELEMAVQFHMGTATLNQDDLRTYNKVTDTYPEILLLHTADMLAAKVDKV